MTAFTFSIHDARLVIRCASDSQGIISNYNCDLYNGIKQRLAKLGFAVTKDPRIEQDHPILSDYHDAGSHGALEFESEIYPIGCKFMFFQNLVTEHPNGGQYDFNKLEKMPYLVRLRWQHTMIALRRLLISRGFKEIDKVRHPNPDPLAYFNARWDMGEMRRGKLRFDRGPDGWPSDKEISKWDRRDRDGNVISHGEIRYFRGQKGYLQRGRVYGGINGMWMVIYGPGQDDCRHLGADELFTCNPADVPRKVHPRRQARLKAELEKAVKAENYERAAVLRDARNRETP